MGNLTLKAVDELFKAIASAPAPTHFWYKGVTYKIGSKKANVLIKKLKQIHDKKTH